MNPPTYPFPLPPLRFAYDALEPHIDAQTMELHHEKHHQTYLDNLNKALEPYPELHDLSIEAILSRFDTLPEAIKATVRNHGGGHANHQFFWKVIGPAEGEGQPDGPGSGELLEAIKSDFGSFAAFKEAFNKAALGGVRLGLGFSGDRPRRRTSSKFSPYPTRTASCCTASPACCAATCGNTLITSNAKTAAPSISKLGGTWWLGTW